MRGFTLLHFNTHCEARKSRQCDIGNKDRQINQWNRT